MSFEFFIITFSFSMILKKKLLTSHANSMLIMYVYNFQPDVDAANLVLCALESSHAALAIMAHQDMPKQLYREEVCINFL